VGERCERCDKPVATDNDWVTTPEGDGEHLCWGSAVCASVDWRARALAAETERDALCAAILDLEHADHSVHSEECDGREHVAGDSCGSDGEGGWTCCEGLAEEGCVAAERERCNCGFVAWRDRMRAAGDLARGFRAAKVKP
jgi:hypothetical protein